MQIEGLFIFILIISGNFLAELFPCRFQKALTDVIILKHFNNIVSKINLNFANFHHKSRNITISSKNFDIKWDFYKNYLIQYSKNKVIKIFPKKKFSLDKMYYDQNSEILKKIKKNKINKINTSAESVIMALKKSLNLKKKIFLKN